MTDKIDEMFASDLSKLSMPSELAANAAAVKASQDPDKKGAEKPDLYAKGKGKGKGGKPAKDEENDERKSKGPNKGEKKDPNAPDKQQGAKSKDDMDKEAADDDERAYTATRYYKKRFLLPGMKETRRTIAIRGKMKGSKPVPRPEAEKKASIDDEFDADMRQIVGAEAADDAPNFDRPDVSVEGQTTDAIDDHFIGWMKDKADEDVVKEANTKAEMAVDTLKRMPTEKAAKKLKQMLMGSGAKGALAATAVTAPVAAGVAYKKGKQKGQEKKAELDKEAEPVMTTRKGKKTPKLIMRKGKAYTMELKPVEKKAELEDEDQVKEAGVQQNPENLDLLARIRKSAEEKAGLGLLAGTGDV